MRQDQYDSIFGCIQRFTKAAETIADSLEKIATPPEPEKKERGYKICTCSADIGSREKCEIHGEGS